MNIGTRESTPFRMKLVDARLLAEIDIVRQSWSTSRLDESEGMSRTAAIDDEVVPATNSGARSESVR